MKIAIAAILAICAFTAQYRDGASGLEESYDSGLYLARAQMLRSGDADWLTFSSQHPPLQGMLLAAMDARILNALAFAAIVTLSYLIGLQILSPALAVVAALAAAQALPLRHVHSWVWSEPVFAALALAAILAYSRRSPMVWLWCSLACLQRYVGVTLLVAVWACLALEGARLKHSAWAAIAATPLIAFAAATALTPTVALTSRATTGFWRFDMLAHGIVETPLTALHFAFPWQSWIFALACLPLVGFGLWRMERTLRMAAVWMALYYLFFLFAQLRGWTDTIHTTRTLAPVWPAMILIALRGLDRMSAAFRGGNAP